MTIPLYDVAARLRDIMRKIQELLDDLDVEESRQESDRVQEVDSADSR